jgi:hypothetical protein
MYPFPLMYKLLAIGGLLGKVNAIADDKEVDMLLGPRRVGLLDDRGGPPHAQHHITSGNGGGRATALTYSGTFWRACVNEIWEYHSPACAHVR